MMPICVTEEIGRRAGCLDLVPIPDQVEQCLTNDGRNERLTANPAGQLERLNRRP